MVSLSSLLAVVALSTLNVIVDASTSPASRIRDIHRRLSATQSCLFLQQRYGNQTLMPNTTQYETEATEYWDALNFLDPACVFTPSSAQEVSEAVQSLKSSQVPFAMRGGGHMTIPGSNSINSTGVLISSTNLNTLQLSEDKSIMSIGPGNHWNSVYEYLEPYGLLVTGGRLGVVGVPGFLLGGGLSFLGNQNGWAATTVEGYECVLADGRIVEVTGTNEYSDLFWALKGGGNSFALVTRFDMKTHTAPKVMVGNAVFGNATGAQFLDAVHSYAYDGVKDTKSSLIPIVNWVKGQGPPAYTAMMFYDGNNSAPAAFENFSAPAMTPSTTTFSYRSMYEWTKEYDPQMAQLHGFRQSFHVVSTYADPAAMAVVHDTYLAAVQETFANSTVFMTGLAPMPMGASFFDASGANPMGVNSSKAPYIWIEESLSWMDPADDQKVEQFLKDVNVDIDAQLAALGMQDTYLYMNDADSDQDVFGGYGEENVQMLKAIRMKYDPEMVFTELMPGGWKVANA